MGRAAIVTCGLVLLFVAGCGDSDPAGQDGDATRDPDVVSTADVGGEVISSGCKSNADCAEGKCNPLKGKCVECIADTHCPEGEKCIAEQCVGGLACIPGESVCDADGTVVMCNEVGTAYLDPESCDDGRACTEDLCIDGTGCFHDPQNSLCPGDGTCMTGVCDPGNDEADESGCLVEVSPECQEGGIADPQPPSVSFPPAVPGEQMTQKNIIIQNQGLGDLKVFGAFVLDEEKIFHIFYPPATIQTEVEFEEPLLVEPGKGVSFTLVFLPEQLGEFGGKLVVKTNDATKPEGEVSVPLHGVGVADNCIVAIPQEASFGIKEVGIAHTMDIQVKNCGDGLVPIYSLGLTNESDKEFAILASLTAPYDLDKGQSTAVTVAFTPGAPDIEYSAVLRLENGAPKTPVLDIPITGIGSAGEAICPIANVDYMGDDLVPPHETLALSGLGSFGLVGEIKTYLWDLEEPAGAHTGFTPGATSSNVTVKPSVCGEYVFKLNVWDVNGTASCNTATQTVLVLPDEDVYAELVWSTPGDADELDSGPQAGADLDLHFTSPMAEGDGWFAAPYDCYWFESNPDWGSPDPGVDDNPKMLFDDSDGAGPEIVAINQPANGTYKIGVHYFADHGFGNSLAKLRVYSKQGKAFETDWVELTEGDLWDVARVETKGLGTQISVIKHLGANGANDIIHDYSSDLIPW